MKMDRRSPKKILLLGFALALVLRPVVVTLHNSGLLRHAAVPASSSLSDHGDPASLSSDERALKKIAKQAPRTKYFLASTPVHETLAAAQAGSSASHYRPFSPLHRLFSLRI